jgi:hypothetical protein
MRHPHLDSSSMTSFSSSRTRSVAISTGHLVYRFQVGCQIVFKGIGALCAADQEIPSDYQRILSGRGSCSFYSEHDYYTFYLVSFCCTCIQDLLLFIWKMREMLRMQFEDLIV